MKKLLILMLVLGMASAAGATPILSGPSSMEPGDTITITVTGVSDEATQSDNNLFPDNERASYTAMIIVDLATDGYYGVRTTFADVTLSSPSAFTANVGGSTSIGPDIYTSETSNRVDWTAGTDLTWSEATDVDVGTWFTFSLTLDSGWSGAVDGSVSIPLDVFDNLGDTVGDGTLGITIVPEPVTIALLGFGGLLLRRRK